MEDRVREALAYIAALDPDPDGGPGWHAHLVDLREILEGQDDE
jgi:hypothetical protein